MAEWEIEEGVTCVVCPKCAFTFDAVHHDPGGSYSCPNCDTERIGPMGIHNGDIVLDRLGSIRRSLQRAVDGTVREIEHRSADESYTATYLSQLNDLARQAAALEDQVVQRLNYA